VGELRGVLDDPNEMDSVKEATIAGLGASAHDLATDILVDALAAHDGLADRILDALALKTGSHELSHLVDRFKDADAALRMAMTPAFRRMKEPGERAMLGLLGEEIGSLRPHIAQILEEVGFVEAAIRRLSNRDAALRRETAAQLTLVGTKAAFRGIVQAARDPDGDVRVQVVKALERLETADGAEILAALQEDPDRRVRKYTHWALERLKAKAL